MNQTGVINTEELFFSKFNYDLSSFFHDEYTEVDSVETPATFMIVYEKKLDKKEFDIFNRLQFRIFYDKEVITGDNPINVKLLCDGFTSQSIMDLAKTICDIFGLDDAGYSPKIGLDFFNKDEFDLFWTIGEGESFISIEKDKDENPSLNILFYNNLIGRNVGNMLKPDNMQ